MGPTEANPRVLVISFADYEKSVSGKSVNEILSSLNEMAKSGKGYMKLQTKEGREDRVYFTEIKDLEEINKLVSNMDSETPVNAQETASKLKNHFAKVVKEEHLFYGSKSNDGQKTLFAPASVAQGLKSGAIQVKGKKGNVKTVSNVQTITQQQQASIAKAFTKVLAGGLTLETPQKTTAQTTQRESPKGASISYKTPIAEAKTKHKDTKQETIEGYKKADKRKDVQREDESMQQKKKFEKTEKMKDAESDKRLQKQKDYELKKGRA